MEDQCEGLNCSGIAGGYDIYLEGMILYDEKVIPVSSCDIVDYEDSVTALGEYYPCDCINYE